ncbi:MAG TPA: cell division protein FtsZ, partial [Candidatus Aenigmarchaeota archaeon]|nr:cell division protein FtsZ [Candidatus Aenigmarchaeota archaeon]
MDFIIKNALKNVQNWDIESGLASQAKIKVVGVGGAGNNIVDWLYQKGVIGAEVIAVNTDKQHLDARSADLKLLIGKELTKGLGAGGFPQIGEQAAKESVHELKDALKDTDLAFICA